MFGIGPRPGGKNRRRQHHYVDRADAGVRRDGGRLSAADPDHLRSVDRLRSVELLPVLLLFWRRSTDRMMGAVAHIEGFEAPMHRALAEPILLGGAPRAIASFNGTVAAAPGLVAQRVGEGKGVAVRVRSGG